MLPWEIVREPGLAVGGCSMAASHSVRKKVPNVLLEASTVSRALTLHSIERTDRSSCRVHADARACAALQAGEQVTFSVRADVESREGMQCFSVSYDAFVDDVMVGDLIIVDGGMAILKVRPPAHALPALLLMHDLMASLRKHPASNNWYGHIWLRVMSRSESVAIRAGPMSQGLLLRPMVSCSARWAPGAQAVWPCAA